VELIYWLGYGGVDETGPYVAASDTSSASGVVEGQITAREFGDCLTKILERGGLFPVLILDIRHGEAFLDGVRAVLEEAAMRHGNGGGTCSDDPFSRYLLLTAPTRGNAALPGETPGRMLDLISYVFRTETQLPVADLLERIKPEQLIHHEGAGTPELILQLDQVMPPLGQSLADQDSFKLTVQAAGTGITGFFQRGASWEATAGELVLDFTGRDEEREQIGRWVTSGEGGLLAVVGDPGTGKSALLGDVVMRASGPLRQALIDAGLAEPSQWDDILAEHGWTATVNLTGLDAAEAAERLGAEAFKDDWGEVTAEAEDWLANEGLTDDWAKAESARQRDPVRRLLSLADQAEDQRLVFIVDGLDESVRPFEVAADLLCPLARTGWVTVVVGTGRSVNSQSGQTEFGPFDLVNALNPAMVIELDRDAASMRRYLAARLLRKLAPGAAASNGDDPLGVLVDDFAGLVASVAGQPFLFARLCAAEVETADDPVALMEEALSDGLERTVGGGCAEVFGRALDRIEAAAPGNRALLEALVLSLGRGVPLRDSVWATMAKGLAPAGARLEADTVLGLLKSQASAYIRADIDLGQTVYRLAHRSFAETVMTRMACGEANPPGAVRSAHQRVVEALTFDVLAAHTVDDAAGQANSRTAGGRCARPIPDQVDATRASDSPAETRETDIVWCSMSPSSDRPPGRVNPYVAYYLPAHCGMSGPDGWGMVESHPEVLDYLTPSRVASCALGVANGPDRTLPNVAAVADEEYLLGRLGDLDQRALVRELQAWCYGTPGGRDSAGVQGDRPYVVWADLLVHIPHRTIMGRQPAYALTAVKVGDRPLLASGSVDGTVRLWDPVTGELAAPALKGHSDGVEALAAVALPNGQRLLASGSFDGTVKLWDLATGQQIGPTFEGTIYGFRSLAALTMPDGRVLLAGGSDDGTVRLWDLATYQQVGPVLVCHSGPVAALTSVTMSDGRVLLASGGFDGMIRFWDPVTSQQAGQALAGHENGVLALTTVALPDGRELLASSGGDVTFRLWDLVAGQQVNPSFEDRIQPAEALAAVTADGRELLVSGDIEGLIQYWDPATGERVGGSLKGHTTIVKGLTTVTVDGQGLLASSGDDDIIQLWGPGTNLRDGSGPKGRVGHVWALAAVNLPDGRELLASGGERAMIRLWDPLTGQQMSQASENPTGQDGALAAVSVNGRGLLVRSLPDGLVWLSDPVTFEPVGPGFKSPTGQAQRLASLNLPDGRTLLATGGEGGTVWLWDLTSDERAGRPLRDETDWVLALAAVNLPDGRTLFASASNHGTIRLWDPATCEQAISPINSHNGCVFALAALTMPDGQELLVSGGDDRIIRLWDPATGELAAAPLRDQPRSVTELAAIDLPDGRRLLASGGGNAPVQLWGASSSGLTPLAAIHTATGTSCLAPVGSGRLAVGLQTGLAVYDLNSIP
jgi:WD40 repeat protein